MTSAEFKGRLWERAGLAGVSVKEGLAEQLEAYFRLLGHWNAKVNLTSLPVRNPTDEAFDRLLVEPLAAAAHIADAEKIWLDLGSGGGSPAIPMKMVRPSLHLTMVEAKARKAAFLREATRVLGLVDTTVENVRFEELALREEFRRTFDLVTVRAVRADEGFFAAVHALLKPRGRLLMFQSGEGRSAVSEGFELAKTVQLLEKPRSYLCSLSPR